ncbi:hypothetical protein [Fibrella aestuarina]|nr:hypothetical protein [Fibrella aestuarina]
MNQRTGQQQPIYRYPTRHSRVTGLQALTKLWWSGEPNRHRIAADRSN